MQLVRTTKEMEIMTHNFSELSSECETSDYESVCSSPQSYAHSPVSGETRVSALFYQEKADEAVPGGLSIKAGTVFFESDPRFRLSGLKRRTTREIVINRRDLLEVKAITMEEEVLRGRFAPENHFLRVTVRGAWPDPDRPRLLLFKVGSREALEGMAQKFNDLIEISPTNSRAFPSTMTVIPCESPDVDNVVMDPLCQSRLSDKVRFSDIGGFDIRGLLEGKQEGSEIISPTMAEDLITALPLSTRFCPWYLAYRINTHGVSLQTFYRQLADQGPSIVLIRDSNNNIFGAFATHSWEPCGRYFGSGECFVFRFNERELEVFPWGSASNEFFQFADDTRFAMGGGGRNALVIESNFLRGLTQPCATFSNPKLTTDEDFVVRDLEVWCFEDI